MTNWSNGEVVANGVRLHYVRTGGARPPLVLAHGHSDNGLCWTRVTRALEADYDLILYDARGHGQSEDGDRPRTREDMAHDAGAFVRALGLERPGIMGHSMGAFTAGYTAALYPDLWRYAILEDPPWFGADGRAAFDARQRRPVEAPQPYTRSEYLAQYREHYPDAHPDDMLPWVESKLQFARHRQDPGRSLDPWQPLVARIACPVLLITGDPEAGAIVSPAVAAEAQALNPRVQVAHIAGAEHSIRRVAFEAYLRAVRAFLAQQYT